MICLICRKDFISVACHVKKHGITPRDYKFEFDIPFDNPLEESTTTKLRSETTKSRVTKEQLETMRGLSSLKLKGSKRPNRVLPLCSVKKIKENNRRNNEKSSQRNRVKFFKNKKIISDYKKGLSFDEISKNSTYTVKILRKYLKTDKSIYTRQFTKETKQKAAIDHSKGMKYKEIAKKYNLNLGRVKHWICNDFK